VYGATLAPQGSFVKPNCATSREDRRDRPARRPDVLRRMRPSCVRVWEALFAKAHGEAIQISLRELSQLSGVSYTHVRRALVELERVRLIKWRPGGRGRGRKSVIEVLWRSYPAKKDPLNEKVRKKPKTALQSGKLQYEAEKDWGHTSLEKNPKREFSFLEKKTLPASPKGNSSQLGAQGWVPSERAVRWGLARARDRLWGLPKPRRERALAALARAFRWGAAQPTPWTRARWKRFVAATLSRFEEGPDGITEARRRPYGWAMRCAKAALAELAQRDVALEATEELLERLRQAREEARQEWASYNGPSWRELIGAAKISKNSRGANA